MAFRVWLLSLNIVFLQLMHVEACIRTSVLFMAEHYSSVRIDHIVSIHALMGIWAIFTFWLL